MIYPYKMGSESVKNLSQALNMKVIKREGSKFKGNENKIVINWGCSAMPDEVMKCKILNKPAAVGVASNKLTFFNKVKGKINIPEFTTSKEVAKEWIDNGDTVLGREVLNGHSGAGIYILDPLKWEDYHHESFKIYVKYIPKKDEYRVHVVNGEVIDVRKKMLKQDYKDSGNTINWKIRNYHNGFIFAKNDVHPPQDVLEQAVGAVILTDLDFGAVDVIWNAFREKAYVLEINTAPGLEGSSVDNYAEAFDKICKDVVAYSKAEEKLKNTKDEFEQHLIKILGVDGAAAHLKEINAIKEGGKKPKAAVKKPPYFNFNHVEAAPAPIGHNYNPVLEVEVDGGEEF